MIRLKNLLLEDSICPESSTKNLNEAPQYESLMNLSDYDTSRIRVLLVTEFMKKNITEDITAQITGDDSITISWNEPTTLEEGDAITISITGIYGMTGAPWATKAVFGPCQVNKWKGHKVLVESWRNRNIKGGDLTLYIKTENIESRYDCTKRGIDRFGRA